MARGGVSHHGRLTVLLTEGLAANPLWLIKYDNNKEEELYEAAFGKLIKSIHGGKSEKEKIAEDRSSVEGTTSCRAYTPTIPSNKKVTKVELSTKSSSSGDDSKKYEVSSSRGISPVISEEFEQLTEEQKKAKNDREQRSLRRQAIIEEPSVGGAVLTPQSGVAPLAGHNTRRQRHSPKANSSQFKKRKLESDKAIGESVKVKLVLLTGTLFLYRGANGHRRAEFIRRV